MLHSILRVCKIITVGIILCATACTENDPSSITPATQNRVNQTRYFTVPSQEILLQSILATLQDQGYNIVKVNNSSEITAQRDGDILISVIVYPTGNKQFAVRANAQHFIGNNNFFNNNLTGYEIIMDPSFYQKEFFNPLSQSLFLQKENLPN